MFDWETYRKYWWFDKWIPCVLTSEHDDDKASEDVLNDPI